MTITSQPPAQTEAPECPPWCESHDAEGRHQRHESSFDRPHLPATVWLSKDDNEPAPATTWVWLEDVDELLMTPEAAQALGAALIRASEVARYEHPSGHHHEVTEEHGIPNPDRGGDVAQLLARIDDDMLLDAIAETAGAELYQLLDEVGLVPDYGLGDRICTFRDVAKAGTAAVVAAAAQRRQRDKPDLTAGEIRYWVRVGISSGLAELERTIRRD